MDIKKTLSILILLILIILSCGCTESNNNSKEKTSVNTQTEAQITYRDAEWVNSVDSYARILDKDSDAYATSLGKLDYYSAFAAIDNYTKNVDSVIKTCDSIQVSPELQSCKEEYRAALVEDYNAVVLTKQGVNYIASGDYENSHRMLELRNSKEVLSDTHYDNAGGLIQKYNLNHPGSELRLEYFYHNASSTENKSIDADTTVQTSTTVTKTLADMEPEPITTHPSEVTNSQSSTSESIFNYCTWQAELKKTIGDYYQAPVGKSYIVITIKINNTGDLTYSTNPNYWHLKIGDMYYQYDVSTYDRSLNYMLTDVGPGGKITIKMAYIVDGEPLISDIEMYYDGPGSTKIINS